MMNMISKEQYMEDPCREASIPYWKEAHISVPDNMKILHDREAAIPDFAEHINKCYEGICISVSELQSYVIRAVYRPELWIAVRNDDTGEIVATGIAELDREIGEGGFSGNDVWHILRKREEK